MPWFPTAPNLINSEILSVHAALVPSGAKGTVLMLGGDEHNPAQAGRDTTPADPTRVDRTALYDVSSRTVVRASSPTTDVFCSGHAFLADGRLLIAGGTESWEGGGGPGGGHVHDHGNFGGHTACWIYNYGRNTWSRAQDMGFRDGEGQGGGRWYPSLVTLGSGDLAMFGGHPSRRSRDWHENDLPERYSSATGAWSWYDDTLHLDHSALPGNWYPRITLIRGGWIFLTTLHNNRCRFFDPQTGTLVGPEVTPPPAPYNEGWDYAVVQLPLVPSDGYRTRLLALDGAQPVKIELDLSAGAPTPEWHAAGTRQGSAAPKARRFACAVYLPTGQIFLSGGINGGFSDANAVHEPELYTPDIDWGARSYNAGAGAWQTIEESARIPRNYHSVALLLPDGSVFTAGSSKNADSGEPSAVAQRNIEIFEPAYFASAGRPTIVNAPKSISTTQTRLMIEVGSSAQAASIRKVALVRCGSVTHAGDFDQRYVALSFSHEAGSVNLEATLPADPTVTPPGFYMLWVVDELDRPCQTAAFVRVAHQSCVLVTDRNTFSADEVGSAATFENALYLVCEGFLPSELPAGPANIRLTFDGNPVPGMVIERRPGVLDEGDPAQTEIPRRLVLTFDVRFSDAAAFAEVTVARPHTLNLTVQLGHFTASASLRLIKEPNPFMLDGDPHWLSTDVRVFSLLQGEPLPQLPSVPGVSSAADAPRFVAALLDAFNVQATGPAPHAFDALDARRTQLEIARSLSSTPVYNFAVARVRYRGQTVAAQDVRVFFRVHDALQRPRVRPHEPLSALPQGRFSGSATATS